MPGSSAVLPECVAAVSIGLLLAFCATGPWASMLLCEKDCLAVLLCVQQELRKAGQPLWPATRLYHSKPIPHFRVGCGVGS